MYPNNDYLSTPAGDTGLDAVSGMLGAFDVHETPHNVFIGHNLGHRVFTMSVPFRKFKDISAVGNQPDEGTLTQRPLNEPHAKGLALYMIKGLVSAAKSLRVLQNKPIPPAFDEVLNTLGSQPYFSIQPLVCNIRDIPAGNIGAGGIRFEPLEAKTGGTAAFRVYLADFHVLWVIDGQHRRHGAGLAIEFLEEVRQRGKYPAKSAVPAFKTRPATEEEMLVWSEALNVTKGFATFTVEVHLGLNKDQERQLFHDLNRLGKKVDPSLALEFDSSNPITQFINNKLRGEIGISVADVEPKDWSEDEGALLLKELVAINAIAFLNKTNISGATPALIEPRIPVVQELWQRIADIPYFGVNRAKEKTVAAQPVVLKALAKVVYDLKFSNRRPQNGDELFDLFIERLPDADFSHENPMWNYYNLSEGGRVDSNISGLHSYLPEDGPGVNRDVGSMQGGFMRFGAKHNDIYPILADMFRWATGLPSRRAEAQE